MGALAAFALEERLSRRVYVCMCAGDTANTQSFQKRQTPIQLYNLVQLLPSAIKNHFEHGPLSHESIRL